MDDDSDAGTWRGEGGEPGRSVAWRHVQRGVPALAVIAVSTAAVLASVMQPRTAAGVVQLREAAPGARHSTCANCGVVVTVVPLEPAGQAGAAGFRLRIRMDDGSLRTVQQAAALAAGSRVLVARGAARALAPRPGQG